VHADGFGGHLFLQSRIGTEQELLAGFAAAVKGSFYQHATEGAVGEFPTVFTCKRHALRNGLVDNGGAKFSQTINVFLASAVVAAFLCIVKKPPSRITIVAVVL